MLNFEALQEALGEAVNTSNGTDSFRELTDSQLNQTLIGEALDYLKGYEAKPDAKVTQKMYAKLVSQAQDIDDFGLFINNKILDVWERKKAALQAENEDTVTNCEFAGAAIGQLLKRVQDRVAKSGEYFGRRVIEHEIAGADINDQYSVDRSVHKTVKPRGYELGSDYDGFQNVRFSSAQLADVVSNIFDDFTKTYGFVLKLTSKNNQRYMSAFPYCTVRQGNDYIDFFSQNEYAQHLSVRRSVQAVNEDAALAII